MNRSLLTNLLLCVAVFLGSLYYLNTLVGDCFHPSLDEGIYLEGGEKLLEGQVPYRDYFAFTGPLVYWTEAGLQSMFGRNMPPLRLSATASLALMVLAVFAITTRFTHVEYGLGAAILYLSYISVSTYMVIVNHRWLSAGFSAAALWAAVVAATEAEHAAANARRKWLWGLAGVFSALSAWATPSFILGVGVYLVWLLLRERQHLLHFVGGVCLISLPAIAWLAIHGALTPMINNLFWVAGRYSRANAVPYGYSVGGPGPKWDDPTEKLMVRFFAAVGAARYRIAPFGVPIILAINAYWAWRGQLSREKQLLALGAAAIFLTSYPRWDLNQMLFVMAPFAVLFALLAFRLPKLAQPVLVVALALWGTYNFSSAWRVASEDPYFPTRAGLQRGPLPTLEAYERLEKLIPERSTLFAFPYLPSLGYALNTRNPVRYAFLQPGMMSAQDEATALGDLERHPPRFILRQYFPDDQVLHAWPNSDRATMAMNSIRQFIDRRYAFVDVIQTNHFRVEVMELRP